MEGKIDFDPLTPEGLEDINNDDYEALLKQDDETEDGWHERMRSRFGRRTNQAISRLRGLFKTMQPRSLVPMYLFYDLGQDPKLEAQMAIVKSINEDFEANVDIAKVEFKAEEGTGRPMVKLYSEPERKWRYVRQQRDTSKLNNQLPKYIQEALGLNLRVQKESIKAQEHLEMKELKKDRTEALYEAAAKDLQDPALEATTHLLNQLKNQEGDPRALASLATETAQSLSPKDPLGEILKSFADQLQTMSGAKEDMQEKIDRLTEDLERSRNFNIDRLTTGESLSRFKEMEEELEQKELELSVLKESMEERERLYASQNEAYLKAQDLERNVAQERIHALLQDRNDAVAQERINTLRQDRNDAREDYYKIKARYDNVKQQAEVLRKAFNTEVEKHGVSLNRIQETEAALEKTRAENAELQKQMMDQEKQLGQKDQALEALEQRLQRDMDPQERERLQARVAELRAQKENLEKTLGLTTQEKIKRALIKAGVVTLAGVLAGVLGYLITAYHGMQAALAKAAQASAGALAKAGQASAGALVKATKATGAGLKKVGREVQAMGKKLGKEVQDLSKKLGEELKAMGKKIAASVPGLLGTVLSLILKTGGELLKFVGNNIWLLVVALGAVLLKAMTERRSSSSSD